MASAPREVIEPLAISQACANHGGELVVNKPLQGPQGALRLSALDKLGTSSPVHL